MGDFAVVGGGVDAVGEKDGVHLGVRVDPDGCAGESGVSEGVFAEQGSGTGAGR